MATLPADFISLSEERIHALSANGAADEPDSGLIDCPSTALTALGSFFTPGSRPVGPG